GELRADRREGDAATPQGRLLGHPDPVFEVSQAGGRDRGHARPDPGAGPRRHAHAWPRRGHRPAARQLGLRHLGRGHSLVHARGRARRAGPAVRRGGHLAPGREQQGSASLQRWPDGSAYDPVMATSRINIRRARIVRAVTVVLAGIVIGSAGYWAILTVLERAQTERTTARFDPPVWAGQNVPGACSGGFYARHDRTIVLTIVAHCAIPGFTLRDGTGR